MPEIVHLMQLQMILSGELQTPLTCSPVVKQHGHQLLCQARVTTIQSFQLKNDAAKDRKRTESKGKQGDIIVRGNSFQILIKAAFPRINLDSFD